MLSVIFFSTSSCQYCRPIKTYLERFKEEFGDNLQITYIVIDKDPSGKAVAIEWGVNAVPILVFIVDGEEKERLIGQTTQQDILDAVKRYL